MLFLCCTEKKQGTAAVAACLSGALYTYTDRQTLTNRRDEQDEEPNIQDFQLSPLTFREPLRDPCPRIVKVCCGEMHTLMLSDQGVIFTWGMNDRGQCGVGQHLAEPFYR